MASRPAEGRKRGVAGLSRRRGSGEPGRRGKRAVDAQGDTANHACAAARTAESMGNRISYRNILAKSVQTL